MKYLDGKYKCKVVKEYPNGSFEYIPLEGVTREDKGKTFTSHREVYKLTKKRI